MRSRAPPVADAARRSTRSGRKNRASEQREDFFGHRKAVGANAAAGYLWSASVRSTDDALASFVSSTASDGKGFVKEESVPLDRVLPTFARTKVGPRRAGVQMNTFCKTPRRRRRLQTIPIGQAYSLCLCKRHRDAFRRDKTTTIVLGGNPSVSLTAASTPYTGKAMRLTRCRFVTLCTGSMGMKRPLGVGRHRGRF